MENETYLGSAPLLTHRRLDPKKHEIRLLTLEVPSAGPSTEAEPSQPICCRVEIVSLDSVNPKASSVVRPVQNEDCTRVRLLWGRPTDSPDLHSDGISNTPTDSKGTNETHPFTWGDYIALSYCWGDSSNQETIFVERQPVKIQATLASALRVLRDKQPVRDGLKIWADALCINQQDLVERNEHVLRMGFVYQSAKQVVCWLGEESPDSRAAMKLVSQVSDEWERSNVEVDRMRFSFENKPALLDEEYWRALGRLMERPYWNRLWIKQELAMGKPDTVLLCGQDALVWNQLYNTVWSAAYSSLAYIETTIGKLVGKGTVSSNELEEETDPLKRKPIYQLTVLQRKLREFTTDPEKDPVLMHRMPAVLDLSRSSTASDNRDKVFGITSMLSTAITSRMPIDYKMMVEQVYLRFAKAVIEGSGNLDIFDHCPWVPGQEVPSWVPDWRVTQYFRLFPGIKRQKPHDACPGKKASWTFGQDGTVLKVSGGVVDTIDGIGGASNATNIGHSSPKMFQSRNPLSNSPTDKAQLRETLWRTITANINTNGERAPAAFENVLDLYHKDSQPQNAQDETFSLQRLPTFRNLMDTTGPLLVSGVPLHACLHPPNSSILPNLEMEQALDRIYRCTRSRRLAVTNNGYLCMVPNGTLPGDIVAVVFGCSLPVIFRQVEGGEAFHLVGTCYCHGVMNGEVLGWLGEGRMGGREFVIL